jgi:hypothetical protein
MSCLGFIEGRRMLKRVKKRYTNEWRSIEPKGRMNHVL